MDCNGKKYDFVCIHRNWEDWKNISIRSSWKVTVDFCQQNKKLCFDKNKIGIFSEYLSNIFRYYKKDDLNQTFTIDVGAIEDDGGKCFKIFSRFIRKGMVEETDVSEKTLNNLHILGDLFNIQEMKLACKESLNPSSRTSLELIKEKIENLSINENQEKELNALPFWVKKILFTSAVKKPKELADEVLQLLCKENEALEKEIQIIRQKHPAKMRLIEQYGWNGLKEKFGKDLEDKNCDPDRNDVSFTAFRDEINNAVLRLLNQVAPSLNIGPIRVDIFGTQGYNSDKDITMRSAGKPPLTTGDMVLMKCIADLLTVQILGHLPGIALDTEWYVDLKFFGSSVVSQEAKSDIQTLNLMLAIMQSRECFKEDLVGYQNYKDTELKYSSEPLKILKEELFNQVEKFYSSINKQVELCRESQDKDNQEWNLYNARLLSQYSRLLLLGERCGALERRIENCQDLNSQLLDDLKVHHDLLYGIINSRQPEGTMSDPELKVTLFSFIGQKPQREKEKIISHSEFLLKENKIFEGELSPRKLFQGYQIIKECEDSPISRKSISRGDLIISGQERCSQFSHMILSNGVISAGKYFLRVLESCYYALQKCQENPGKLNVEALKQLEEMFVKSQDLYSKALHFEQCKRGKKLNRIAFEQMILDVLKKKGCKNEQMKEHIQELGSMDELGGQLYHQRMGSKEKIYCMVNYLYKKGYLNKNERQCLIEGENVEEKLLPLYQVICARAGAGDIAREMLKEGELIVLEHYQLNNPEAERVLRETVQQFYLQVQDFMVQYGYLDPFHVEFVEKMDIRAIWENEKK